MVVSTIVSKSMEHVVNYRVQLAVCLAEWKHWKATNCRMPTAQCPLSSLQCSDSWSQEYVLESVSLTGYDL